MRTLLNSLVVTLVLIVLNTAGLAQWRTTTSQLAPRKYISGYSALRFKDGLLWAAADKLFVSADTGRTWTECRLPDSAGTIFDVAFYDRDTGIVCAAMYPFNTA